MNYHLSKTDFSIKEREANIFFTIEVKEDVEIIKGDFLVTKNIAGSMVQTFEVVRIITNVFNDALLKVEVKVKSIKSRDLLKVKGFAKKDKNFSRLLRQVDNNLPKPKPLYKENLESEKEYQRKIKNNEK